MHQNLQARNYIFFLHCRILLYMHFGRQHAVKIECWNFSTRFLQHAVCQNACTVGSYNVGKKYNCALADSDACSTFMHELLGQKSSVFGVPKNHRGTKWWPARAGLPRSSTDLQLRARAQLQISTWPWQPGARWPSFCAAVIFWHPKNTRFLTE